MRAAFQVFQCELPPITGFLALGPAKCPCWPLMVLASLLESLQVSHSLYTGLSESLKVSAGLSEFLMVSQSLSG